MAQRPWHGIPIVASDEPLQPLPEALLRLQPHPYMSLGAPYGSGQSPFALRRGVVTRLLQAQQALQRSCPELQLAIFDGWRPIAVQQFMVSRTLVELCLQQGVDPQRPSPERDRLEAEVGRFWAPPSRDPATPPPHSTGAAVDLTLATVAGQPLDMGGAIDAIGAISEPGHYADAAGADPSGSAARWHHRRQCLSAAMATAGFAQHPNEWWHFSWGDQLWAWRSGAAQACYGAIEPLAGWTEASAC